MKDRKGNDAQVGDQVYVSPKNRIGGLGHVRRISEDGRKCRIDDGAAADPNLDTNGYTWAAWCVSGEFEKV